MDERVASGEAAGDHLTVADVPDDELRLPREVRRHALVHLRVEQVEDPHLVPVGEQALDEVGADEAGAAGDENAHHLPR